MVPYDTALISVTLKLFLQPAGFLAPAPFEVWVTMAVDYSHSVLLK